MSANIKASTDGTQAIIGVGGADQMTVSNAGVVTANSFVGALNSSSVTATGSTTARSLADRFADVVNVLDFGAHSITEPGYETFDSTAAIQDALNTGKTSVFIPSGKYNFTSLIIPQTRYLTIYGEGTSSVLVQKGTGIKYPEIPSSNTTWGGFGTRGVIRDLKFDGTNGTGNTLDTSFTQETDLINLYFENIPEGYSALKINGNPNNGVYIHDMRLIGLRIYNKSDYNKNSIAGIYLGSQTSDSQISDFIMQGMGLTDYCIFFASGVSSIILSDSHPFNAKKNVIRFDGNNNDIQVVNCQIDNSGEDNVYLKNTSNLKFTSCHFQIGRSNNSWGVTFDNSYNTTILNSKFTPLNGNTFGCAREINVVGNGGNKIVYAVVERPDLFITNLFTLTGNNSYVKGLQFTTNGNPLNPNWPKSTTYATIYSLNGSTPTSQPLNTTRYLGANGAQINSFQSDWCAPFDGYIVSSVIVSTVTPPTNENYTFELYRSTTLLGTGTITSGQFKCVIVPQQSSSSISQGDSIYIKSIFSSGAGPSNMRYSVNIVS